MRVVEVNSIDGLPGLRLAWRSLLSETPGASFHQSCEWMEAICRHQLPTLQLRILLVTGGGETVGILPFVQTLRDTPFGTQRVVGYPNDRWSPFQAPLGPHPTATLMAGLRYLSDVRHSWDVLELRDVDRAAREYQRTRTALQVADMKYQETDEVSGYNVIELQRLPHDFVTNVRLARPESITSATHGFSCPDHLTYERHRPRGTMYDDATPRWDLFERCLELTDGDRQFESNEFLRDVHAAACRSGAADMNLLRRGNEILACCYNVHIAGVLVCILGGTSGSPRPNCTDDPCLMDTLLAKMLEDSVSKHDVKWITRTEFSLPAWPFAPLRQAQFVYRRQRTASRLMRRMTRWLPHAPPPRSYLATLPPGE